MKTISRAHTGLQDYGPGTCGECAGIIPQGTEIYMSYGMRFCCAECAQAYIAYKAQTVKRMRELMREA